MLGFKRGSAVERSLLYHGLRVSNFLGISLSAREWKMLGIGSRKVCPLGDGIELEQRGWMEVRTGTGDSIAHERRKQASKPRLNSYDGCMVTSMESSRVYCE